jgi:hypothetical protein
MGTAYTVQNPPHAGATLTVTAPAASGNTAPCGNGVGLLVINPSGGTSITVTINVPAAITHDGLGIGNATPGSGGRAVTIASPGYALIPLVAGTYRDPDTGLATFAVSGTLTNVLAAAISITS